MMKILTVCAVSCLTLACSRTPSTAPDGYARTTTEVVRSARTDDAPNTIRVRLTIMRRADLKVKVGDEIREGDVLSDREQERAALQSQRRMLELSLRRVSEANTSPTYALALPPVSYAEAEANIRRAETALQQIIRRIETQQARLTELSRLPNLPPSIREHETARFEQLRLEQQSAQAEVDLARARLETTRQQRAYLENDRANDTRREQLTFAERRQQAEIQSAQLQTQIAALDERIRQASVVRAPFSGHVVRVQWEGQTNHEINLILLIAVDIPDSDGERAER